MSESNSPAAPSAEDRQLYRQMAFKTLMGDLEATRQVVKDTPELAKTISVPDTLGQTTNDSGGVLAFVMGIIYGDLFTRPTLVFGDGALSFNMHGWGGGAGGGAAFMAGTSFYDAKQISEMTVHIQFIFAVSFCEMKMWQAGTRLPIGVWYGGSAGVAAGGSFSGDTQSSYYSL